MKSYCTKLHLCENCIYSYPSCNANDVKFGYGKGNDNVIECDIYNQGDKETMVCPQDCMCCK